MIYHDEEKQVIHSFACNVRKLREKAGISQEKLAELSGLHRTYIGSLERSEKNPSLITIKKIASALNINISKLID